MVLMMIQKLMTMHRNKEMNKISLIQAQKIRLVKSTTRMFQMKNHKKCKNNQIHKNRQNQKICKMALYKQKVKKQMQMIKTTSLLMLSKSLQKKINKVTMMLQPMEIRTQSSQKQYNLMKRYRLVMTTVIQAIKSCKKTRRMMLMLMILTKKVDKSWMRIPLRLEMQSRI